MKCQHCENREAEHHFVVNWMGMQYNIHLCNECREEMTDHYMEMIEKQHGGIESARNRSIGEISYPVDAGEKIRRRRKLNVLRGRLNEAVASEEYETAARLRDEISYMEKEVLVP